MQDITVATTIDRSHEAAFEFTIDPNNTPQWVDSIVEERCSTTPAKLGSIYSNQGRDGTWADFEITAFDPGRMFEMTKKDDSHHIQYTFNAIGENQCELEYRVWVAEGSISERFTRKHIETVLQKLRSVIEKGDA